MVAHLSSTMLPPQSGASPPPPPQGEQALLPPPPSQPPPTQQLAHLEVDLVPPQRAPPPPQYWELRTYRARRPVVRIPLLFPQRRPVFDDEGRELFSFYNNTKNYALLEIFDYIAIQFYLSVIKQKE